MVEGLQMLVAHAQNNHNQKMFDNQGIGRHRHCSPQKQGHTKGQALTQGAQQQVNLL